MQMQVMLENAARSHCQRVVRFDCYSKPLTSCTLLLAALLSCLQVVNDSKERINELKALIEQRRVQRAMSGDEDGEDPEEERCKDLIEQVRVRGTEGTGHVGTGGEGGKGARTSLSRGRGWRTERGQGMWVAREELQWKEGLRTCKRPEGR